MFHRFARILVLLAAVQILGGHWAVLQSVAWVKMVVDYSQTDTVTVALEKTFDGAHPCNLCNVVSKGRAAEQSSPLAKDVLKLKFEAILAPIAGLLPPRSVPAQFFVVASLPSDAFFSTPVPPPRRA